MAACTPVIRDVGDYTDEINQTIRLNLERRPNLQKRYEALTGRRYTPDWWRTYSASHI